MATRFLSLLALLWLVPRLAAAEVDFSRDVRPVLAEMCFHCHGPDEKTRKADLRLDTREGLTTAAKEVLTRVLSKDPDEQMPPPKSGKKPTAAQSASLKAWVEQGAKWSGHWAFETPKQPVPPQVKDSKWDRNPIDAFVLARLEKEGLKPTTEAAKETLIRRLSLDLIGLGSRQSS
jgi:hypothetical protein